jgi:hypothetical protein
VFTGEDGKIMENSRENRITAAQCLILVLKAAVVLAAVFFALYRINAKIAALLAEERANEDYEILDHYDGQFQEIYEKRVMADYIMLGTSHFTHGVTPEELEKSGKKFFNFALNGSNPSYYVWWYNDVFKPNKYPKPEAVIFGVDWFMFDTDWLWRKPDFDYRYLRETPDDSETPANKYEGKWYDLDALFEYATNRFPLFSSRSRAIDLLLPEKLEKAPKDYYITPDGFVLSSFYKGYVPWQADFHGGPGGNVRTNFKEKEKESLISLLDEFRDEGIPVIFVMAPEYLQGRKASRFDEMTEIIASIAEAYNIPFLNYNTELASEINEDHNYYSDWGHLNDAGAHLFSQKLYADLSQILDFD